MRLIGRLNRLLGGLNLVLLAAVVCVAVALLRPGQRQRGPVAPPSPAGPVRLPDVTEQVRDSIDPKLVLERNIFGAGPRTMDGGSNEADAVARGRPVPAARPELPLRLLGTVIAEKNTSYAVLENLATKAQDIYRVGDMIGDARIDGIEQNQVVVVSGGVREILSIVLTSRDAPAAVVASQTPPPEPSKAGPGEVVRVVSDAERQINTGASSRSMDRAAQFLSKLQLSPHVTHGQSNGLQVSGLGDSAMAQLVGLRDGDIIRAVNGHVVPNQRKAAQVLRKARSLGSAEIELLRGQQRKSLTFRAGSW